MSIKRYLRALLPAFLLSFYHWLAAWTVVLFYGWPARKLIVIGVTGTKGKTTTAHMIWHILSSAGFKTALISTALFAVGKETWLNNLKMTMPSRVTLQKFLQRVVKAGCTHLVIETSSEGLAQWRHLGLPYRVAVLTNLAPEHIEAHGSFENYRSAKGRLFKFVANHGGTAVINLDDASADYFISQAGRYVWGYTLGKPLTAIEKMMSGVVEEVTPTLLKLKVNGTEVNLTVGGEFNAHNTLAAMTAVLYCGVTPEQSAQALALYEGTPGRLEFVQKQPFAVVVDYAHTPESLSAIYKTLKSSGRMISVLGSCGGGRDKNKRPVLGRLAGEYADYVIITNEDPYDENPRSIMEQVAEGVRLAGKRENENYWIVEERREAIRKALSLAHTGDTVIITGKGAEQWMCVAGDKKIPWDDRQVAKDLLTSLVV